MSVLKLNIAANFAGNIWTGLMGIVFVPIYINLMGIEAYGLIGIFTTLLALSELLDMGLSTTLNREMARLSVDKNNAQQMRDLVRTLEIPYWIVGLLICLIVIVISPAISNHWVNTENIPPESVHTAVILMGLAVAFQWPMSFYSGGLMGLQRQVLLNAINAVMATFRGIGAVLILWIISPTIKAFFLWQIIVSIIHITLITFFLWRSLPYASEPPLFSRELLKNIWRFAAGMTGITVLSTILTQLDKIILSRMLNLEMFGYYNLANSVSITLYRLISPVFSAVYPRMTNLAELDEIEDITILYHKSSQLMSIIILPAAVVLGLFSKEILLIWTQNSVTTENVHILVSIFMIGTSINGLMHIPYALQLAYGWTQLSIIFNIVSVILLVPLMIALTKCYGMIGAASVWIILNAGYIFIIIPIMHNRLLSSEKWRWYFQDVLIPILASLTIAGSAKIFIASQLSQCVTILYIFAISTLTFTMTAMTTSTTRSWMFNLLKNINFKNYILQK